MLSALFIGVFKVKPIAENSVKLKLILLVDGCQVSYV